MDTTLDLRQRIMELNPLCLEMVRAARRCGASANYTGSGGAIVAATADPEGLAHAERAIRAVGAFTSRVPDNKTVTSG
jgi:glucuronokinase